MRNLLSILFIASMLVLASCSNEDSPVLTPQLNFDQPRYSLSKGDVQVKLVAEQAAASRVEVPFTFSGTAVKDTDFTASASYFTFNAGETEAVIILTRIEENIGEEEKSLTITLGAAPAGFEIGTMSFTAVELYSNMSIFASFTNDVAILTESSDYTVNLEKMDGTLYRVADETTFEVEVDEASTAEEGVHFEFAEGKTFKIAKNKNSGAIAVNFLKKEADKDKIVLRLKDKDGFAFGSNATITITVQGPYTLNGTWAFSEISNIDWWATSWGQDTSNFPKGTSADKITFSGNSHTEYTFTHDIKGDLKNFFITNSKATYQGEEYRTFQEMGGISRVDYKVAVLKFEKVNVNFSASNEKIREAVVAFRIINVDGKEVLECTIDDFEPTDFLADTYNLFKDFGEVPVMASAPLRIHFTRSN